MKTFIISIVLLTILLIGAYHLGKYLAKWIENAEDIIKNNY